MLEIERAWGKHPGWWSELPKETRIELLAWQRIHAKEEEAKRARRIRRQQG